MCKAVRIVLLPNSDGDMMHKNSKKETTEGTKTSIFPLWQRTKNHEYNPRLDINSFDFDHFPLSKCKRTWQENFEEYKKRKSWGTSY